MYGWARHLDRAADSGLRLPAVWQQFLDAAVQVRWQSCQHVPQIGPRVVAMHLGLLRRPPNYAEWARFFLNSP